MNLNKSFYLMRHGQTDWNILKRVQGTNDIPLNETGKKQINYLKNKIDHIKPDKIYSSPLTRAKQSAEILAGGLHYYESQNLKETDSVLILKKLISDKGYNISKIDFTYLKESNECYENYEKRILQGLSQILSDSNNPLIIGHGSTIAIICSYLNIQIKNIPNASIFYFQFNKKYRVISV